MEKKEFIMCAAIRRKETCDCPKVYNVKDIYDCELGWRHPDILHKFRGIVSTSMSDQGFSQAKAALSAGMRRRMSLGRADSLWGIFLEASLPVRTYGRMAIHDFFEQIKSVKGTDLFGGSNLNPYLCV